MKSYFEQLKEANVNIHIVSTGVCINLPNQLWDTPGSSAYLSGSSFPYSKEEQEDLLGFTPEHFCSEEAAIDLASVAYMKAFKFNGKFPVGIGVTASVSSEKEHRGDHKLFICTITNEKIQSFSHILPKGSGSTARLEDRDYCNNIVLQLLLQATLISSNNLVETTDTTEMAKERFFLRPFFAANGKRLSNLPNGKYALMPGAFNPPHQGHFGMVEETMEQYNYRAAFEITSNPPHKEALSVQSLLQRAKLLQGYDRLFTKNLPLYKDKSAAYPNRPLVLGADAMLRMLDPKWGVDIGEMFNVFYDFGTKLLVAGRDVNNDFITCNDILDKIKKDFLFKIWSTAIITMKSLEGDWNVSSTELRKQNNIK